MNDFRWPLSIRQWFGLYTVPLWLVCLLVLTTSSGCRGCLRKGSEELSREEVEKRAREQKDAIQASQLRSLPADAEVRTLSAKPGHWVETVRSFKSNREDLQVIATGDVLRGPDKILNIPGTNLTAEFSRATVLPKGQTKTIDLQFFVPTTSVTVDPLNPVSTSLRLRSGLVSRALLTPLMQEPYPTNELKHAEYLMVVVSPKPLDYAFLSASDLVLWKGSDLMQEERTRSYHVILCASQDGKVALPTSMLTMTSTAVIVWDDVAPDDLSADQQTALVDWLHWGGQLLVSGPSSWSRLQNSFLAPYLPVKSAGSVELGTEDFQPLNHWVVPDMTGLPSDALEIVGAKMPGLEMQLSEDAHWLPHAEQLVAERGIGRGRIVVTGFPIREQRLTRWKYFSSFFSTGLLRRPARTVATPMESFTQLWAAPFSSMERDPRLNTRLRIASRDMPLSHTQSDEEGAFAQRSLNELWDRAHPARPGESAAPRPTKELRATHMDSELTQWSANGAAWSDTSGFAFRAVTTLREAAGIVLPDRWTIITLVASYLTILVPLNWLIFRLIGRLEWAWIAAPIIALLAVVVITRVTRLDIGFARRTTEVGLLELHGTYGRGHMTKYTALYTSLSTNYAMDYLDRGSVALPLGDIARGGRRSSNTIQKISAKYGQSPGIRLEPVTVYSNSTEMIHAEQMLNLPGGILYGEDKATLDSAAIKNTTGLVLKSCATIRLSPQGNVQFAWIGNLDDDQTRRVQFVTATEDAVWKFWNRESVTRRSGVQFEDINVVTETVDASALMMGPLLNELWTALPISPGQVRLVGYTEDRPGGMEIQPDDGRTDSRTVVLAHLRAADWTDITRDERILGPLPNAVDAELREAQQQPESE